MFNKSNNLKSESDRLCPPTELAGSGSSNQPQQQQPDRVKLLSSSSTRTTQQELAATTLHQHYLNYYSKKIPKEEIKSQHKACVASTSSQSQQLDSSHHQTTNHLEMQQSSSSSSSPLALADHQRGQQNGRYKTSNTYQQPPFQNQHHVNLINQTPRTSVPRDEAQTLSSPFSTTSRHNQMMPMNGSMKQRTFSASAIMAPNPHHTHTHAHNHHQHQNHSSNHRRQDELGSTNLYSNQTRHNSSQDGQQVSSQHQSDRGSEEVATIAIREELENDLDGFKEGELDTLSSLERTLPIELSFLIKQQAYCMARMNYLDRQIRELRESANQVDSHTAHVSSTSNNRMIPNHPQNHHNNHHHHHHHNNHHHHQQNPATIMTHTKNGNFILSDDSGGEYSRATISDDDELSSLLDQIVKTVKPERGAGANFAAGHGSIQQQQQLHHLQQPRSVATANYTAITSQPGQQYAFVNPSQIHHPHYQQAVPIFVMGSPVAVAHPASSISSNVLPGVHFQPEPRYNQYYEGFYCQNYGQPPSGSSLVQQRSATTGGGLRGPSNQHFDNSMSAIEQLVSQKEKRQIKSQLRSADNWLRMRASGHAPTDSSFNNGHSRSNINAASSSSSSSSSATTTTTTPNGTTTTTTTNHRESEISPDKSNGQSATSSTTTGRSNHNIPTSSSAATIATTNKNHCEIDDNSDR